MPLVSTRVDVSFDFERITREVHAQAERAVERAAREGAAAATAVAAKRSKTGRMAAITAGNATRTPDGYIASFVSPVHYAWFQNYGTLGSRRKRLKQAPRTDRTRAPGTGIEPLGFLEAGRKAGLVALRMELARGF